MRSSLVVALVLLAGCQQHPSPSPSPSSSPSPPPSRSPSPSRSPVPSPPDLATPDRRELSWRLFNCKNAPGCTGHGDSGTCAELGIKNLTVTVTQDKTHQRAVTKVPCPAAASSGELTVAIPAASGDGPWSVRVTSDDKPTLRSEILCNVTHRCLERRRFVLLLYAQGCTDPECVACGEGNHAPGWCD
jgi:hypothetical protein